MSHRLWDSITEQLQHASNPLKFGEFYDALSEKGFLIYPGKLTVAETFRIGCIGNLNEQDMHDTITAIKEVVNDSNFLVN